MQTHKNQLSNKYTGILLSELKNGIYANISHLPSEHEIAKQFGISRTVVRDCLAILEQEGFITRKHGIGTIVNAHVLSAKTRIDLEEEFLDMVASTGHRAAVIQVDYEYVCSKELDEKLNIYGKNFLKVVRTITSDEQPAIYCEDYISEVLIKNHNYNLSDLSKPIFDFLSDFCNIQVYMDLSEIMAINADTCIAKKLAIKENTSVLYIDEIGYTLVGQPVLYSKEYYVNNAFHHMILRKKI